MSTQPSRAGSGKRLSRFAIMVLLLPAFAGCMPIHGHWRLVRAMPHRDVFAIHAARFDKNGAYAATVTLDGRTRDETGTYERTFSKLHLLPAGGGRRTYNINRTWGQLQLMAGERKCILEKAE